MKALKYSDAAVPTIAAQRGVDPLRVTYELTKAEEWGWELYAVVDFVRYVSREPVLDAIYISGETLHQFYEFVEPEHPTEYREVRVKDDR